MLTANSSAVGMLYPSYSCYKALKYNATNIELLEHLVRWAIAVAFVTISQAVLDPLFAFWLPFYHVAKLGITIWLVAPQTKGATTIFVKYVEPFLRQAEQEWNQGPHTEGR